MGISWLLLLRVVATDAEPSQLRESNVSCGSRDVCCEAPVGCGGGGVGSGGVRARICGMRNAKKG